MAEAAASPTPSSLPSDLADHARGPYLGRLEGFTATGGLSGWACRWPPAAAPLELNLSLEDLLAPTRRWVLARLIAQRPRPDLQASGLPPACGFLFLGHSGVELPPPGRSMVVRAFFDPERRHELPGSPLPLDGERFAILQELCRIGLGRRARLSGLDGLQVCGWATGSAGLQLRLDGGEPWPITPPDPLPPGEWPFQLDLPTTLCDAGLHHLQLETEAGEAIDERFELFPSHLTPWPALLEHSRPPFPDHLSPLARERHRSLQGWLQRADRGAGPLPAQLPLWQRLLSQPLRRDSETGAQALPEATEPGPDGTPVARVPLQLPVAAEPQASIVIPVHGQYAVTRRCLAAIAYAPTTIPYEVIVVDDGSRDDTAAWLAAEAPGVRVVRHDFTRGFNQACCSGAACAAGEFVVLLNNDTEPCAHWLEELLDPFRRWPDTGLVGAQMILADGRLQEAGGIVWGNGEPWNYGRGGSPYDPRYAYARQIDYASGAALAIRAQTWRQVGGFSPEFSPAYYEDTDLAFKVRQAGLSVRYAPLARVIHPRGGEQRQQHRGGRRAQALPGHQRPPLRPEVGRRLRRP